MKRTFSKDDIEPVLKVAPKIKVEKKICFNSMKPLAAVPLRVVGGLGEGGFGTVVRVLHDSGTTFAMKVVPKSTSPRSRDQDRLRVELLLMTELAPSPFLQRCHMAFESTTDVFFVVDFAAGGDLFAHLEIRGRAGRGCFTDQESRVLLSEIVLGLMHLHTHGYIHRDIKV